jgi:SagB-type dehydrogenase family enzyme
MPSIALPEPNPLRMPLGDTLAKRVSFDHARTERPFTKHELGSLLGNALGMRNDVNRKYPSGGALYPIETYLVGTVLEGYKPGVFHYHPKAHALEHLWEMSPALAVSDIIRGSAAPPSHMLLVFTAVWRRSSIKYGDWSYHPALFEAGHMGQNILLAATAMQAQTRPVGGFDDDVVSELLGLDEREQPVHSILLVPSTEPFSA